ncbi:MAG: CDP-diacylglycerol--serine O-phosphatidyltransferase [Candidatus Malihini olakiniferum]
MLSTFKRNKYQKYLSQLPKLPQSAGDVQTLISPELFRITLINLIQQAKVRFYLVTLYLEQDDGGQRILSELYRAKRKNPNLDVRVLVDWHRAQRGRIGEKSSNTNADWYCDMAEKHSDMKFPIYGIPVNTREALGVLHLKGFIVDDSVLYSGASLNNFYLHQHSKYRYDRYQLIRNMALADTMSRYINTLLKDPAIQRLDRRSQPKNLEIKANIRQLRQMLRSLAYDTPVSKCVNGGLTVTPLVGLGKQSLLNNTIHHLMFCTEYRLVMCTPYFNLPTLLIKNVVRLLKEGKHVEIIIGDKIANDFFIQEDQPFKIISALPYLYEINLRRFIIRLQRYIDNQKLTIRLWKDGDNTFHLKGLWADDTWQLLTGNNLNPRAWRLDLENAIVIHDPEKVLLEQRLQELSQIYTYTTLIKSYKDLQSITQYPVKVQKLIRRLRRIKIDRLISQIL